MEIRDGLFGTVLVKLGFCRPADIEDALRLQEKYRESGKRVPRLGELLASQGKVSPDQIQAVLSGSLNAKPGRRFGEICAELRFATKDQILTVLKEQKKLDARQNHVASGDLMLQQGFLRREQVRTVLAAQGLEARLCPICNKIYNVPAGMQDDFNDCPACTGPLVFYYEEDEITAQGAEVVSYAPPAPDLPHHAPGAPPPRKELEDAATQDMELPESAVVTEPVSGDLPVAEPPSADESGFKAWAPAAEPQAAESRPVVPVGKPAPEAREASGMKLAGGSPEPPRPPVDLSEEDLPMVLPDDEAEGEDLYGRFRVLKVIGEDGHSVLYEAEDTGDGSTVALRVFSDSLGKEYIDEVRREFAIATRVTSEFLKRPLEIGREDGYIYVAEEFVRGKSLRTMFEEGHIPLRVMTSIVQQIGTLMRECHGRGLAHMGLRPSQILLTPLGKVKVGGFGYPKDAIEDMRRIVEVSGEVPIYSAPELAVDGLPRDHRADIYSIGAIYYHGVTGRPPYFGNSVGELLLRISTEDAVPADSLNPRVPQSVSEILARMLAIDPQQRYADIAEVLQALSHVAELESSVVSSEALAFPDEDAQPEGIRPSRRVTIRAARGSRRKSRKAQPARSSRRKSDRSPAQPRSEHGAGRRPSSKGMKAPRRGGLGGGLVILGLIVAAVISVGIYFLVRNKGG
ncbi:MAG: serine/threonine protein kinase [Planctomycetes bacterium]|nr:serine/threonine protein kinase [Planctomycetota bacterium]